MGSNLGNFFFFWKMIKGIYIKKPRATVIYTGQSQVQAFSLFWTVLEQIKSNASVKRFYILAYEFTQGTV